MAKAKKRGKKVVQRLKHKLVRHAKKVAQKFFGGRKASKNSKASKVKKLIRLAKLGKLGKKLRKKKGKRR